MDALRVQVVDFVGEHALAEGRSVEEARTRCRRAADRLALGQLDVSYDCNGTVSAVGPLSP